MTSLQLAGQVAGLSDEKLNIFSIILYISLPLSIPSSALIRHGPYSIGLRLTYNTIYISDKGSKILSGFLRWVSHRPPELPTPNSSPLQDHRMVGINR